jgi:hypothetical protein
MQLTHRKSSVLVDLSNYARLANHNDRSAFDFVSELIDHNINFKEQILRRAH